MKKIIEQAMANLSHKRPIFHSEADFQHSLSWELRNIDPNLDIRLEVPFALNSERRYVDLIIRLADRVIFVELKYKTRESRHHLNGELFALKNQGAIDQGAYDILKDLWRIEQFVSKTPNSEGFVLVISNDSRYWSQPVVRAKPSIDEEFKLTNNRAFHGTLSWHSSAGSGSTKGREFPIKLRHTYIAEWRGYSTAPEIFQSLCFHIGSFAEVSDSSVEIDLHSNALATTAKDHEKKIPQPVKPVNSEQGRRPPNWQVVLEALTKLGGQASLAQIRDRFAIDNPDRKPVNARHELVLMSVNHPKRIHYGQAQKPRFTNTGHAVDKVFLREDGNYEFYAPEKHGVWEIYNAASGTPAVRQAE